MKVAITADIHLNGDTDYRERFNALVEVLKTIKNEKIQHLIIAGDCFDQENSKINILEKALEKADNTELRVFLLPGNHDFNISNLNFLKVKFMLLKILKKLNWEEGHFFLSLIKNKGLWGQKLENLHLYSRIQNGYWLHMEIFHQIQP